MNRRDILLTHQNIVNALTVKKVSPAILRLKTLIAQIESDDLNVLIENYERTYRLILDYTIKGVEDPQRPVIYKQLIKSLLTLNDKVKTRLKDKLTTLVYQNKKQVLTQGKVLHAKLEEYQDDEHISDELTSLLSDMQIDSTPADDNAVLFLNDLFHYAWFNNNYSDSDMELLRAFFESPNFPDYSKSLIVSATTLGLLNNFDAGKLQLLARLSATADKQVGARAFTGFMFAMYLYDKYRPYFPAIDEALKDFKKNKNINIHLEFFLIQLVKAKDTEKFTRKMREEIIPDIVKHAPQIQDRLDFENILPEDMEEEKNPKWQKILEESPDLMRKLEELSKLQLEGTDIFMSTFAMLKHFPFFSSLPNWLMPFFKENPDVENAMQNEEKEFKETFLTALEKSGHICNSDKYSFCLNVSALPQAQKKMMLQMFKAELDNVNEVLSEDKRINEAFSTKIIFTQYIQDLYRFYKLYPQKNEFQDMFALPLDFYNCNFFKEHLADEKILVKLADFYFESSHFNHATDLYSYLITQGGNTQVLFEKLGFAWQQLKDYEKAVDAYKKAELFELTTWLCTKIAFCYRKMNKHKDALAYYHEAEKIEPDNMKIQLSIANCYLNLEQTETALNHYYKLELLASDNIKVLRPIAWCLFILKRADEAGSYFERLMKSSEINKFDLMNYAHWLWSTGDIQKAAATYLKCIKQKDNTFEAFLKSFREDEKYLTPYGISKDDTALMIEYLALTPNS